MAPLSLSTFSPHTSPSQARPLFSREMGSGNLRWSTGGCREGGRDPRQGGGVFRVPLSLLGCIFFFIGMTCGKLSVCYEVSCEEDRWCVL